MDIFFCSFVIFSSLCSLFVSRPFCPLSNSPLFRLVNGVRLSYEIDLAKPEPLQRDRFSICRENIKFIRPAGNPKIDMILLLRKIMQITWLILATQCLLIASLELMILLVAAN